MSRAPFAHIFVLVAFLVNSFGSVPIAQAQDFSLPTPGVMIHLSSDFNPLILKGIKVHPDNPFRFDFILDKGDSRLSNDQLKDESSKLIKYFLAGLTIPEKDLWVNLSPYEKDRIIPKSFGLTEMGRDLLAEDYMLKQITASLIYPEDVIGKKFWKRIYEEAQKKYGTTNVPVNTFNKVWIVPQKAVVYENAKAATAYVVESKLKVMLEGDYLSLEKHEGSTAPAQGKENSQLGSDIVREVVIPELTKEVNEDKNFAKLRQVYNSLILATWYKKKIKDSILEQVYTDKNKIAGINIDDPKEKDRIYQKYLKAFKMGVFNYIKEDKIPNSFDPNTGEQQTIPRKYFSGGVDFVKELPKTERFVNDMPNSAMISKDRAMIIQSDIVSSAKLSNILNDNARQVKVRNDQFSQVADRAMTTPWKIGENDLMVVDDLFFDFMALLDKVVRSPVWQNTVVNFKSLQFANPLKEQELIREFHIIRKNLGAQNWSVSSNGYSDKDLELLTSYFVILTSFLVAKLPKKPSDQIFDRLSVWTNGFDANKIKELVRDYFSKPCVRIRLSTVRKKDQLERYLKHERLHWAHVQLNEKDKNLLKAAYAEFLKDPEGQGILLEIYNTIGNAYFYYNQLREDVDKHLKNADINRFAFWDEFWTQIAYPSDVHNEHSLRSEEMRVVARLCQSNEVFRQAFDLQERLIKDVSDAQAVNDLKTIGDLAMRAENQMRNISQHRKASNTGGIDLTVANMNLQTQNNGGEIKFHLNQTQLTQLQDTPGFVPVIINIHPMTNLRQFLGLNVQEKTPG